MKNCLVIFCCYLSLIEFCSSMLVTPHRSPVGVDRYRARGPALPLRAPISRNVFCPAITLKNGIARRRGARARVVRYVCNQGYLLAGEKHSSCVRNKWDPPPPRCVRPTCKTIATPVIGENLLVHLTHHNAVQHFFCKAGYTLNGPRVIYCDGVSWSDNLPICLAKDTKPQLSCDFESTDLCGWTPDLNHDFDWTRENYNTPSGSIGTGPSSDHSKGPGHGGYYMYIESSSKAENDTARLISPVYEKMGGEVCFEFFYHMFGATIGSLRVYVKTVNESWSLKPESAFFYKSGNQGDRWYRGYHHLGILKDEFQIIIEGVRGAGYVSDIAVDDVKIIPNCTYEEETTTTMESSTSNELIPLVDSCENRCGQTEPMTHDISHLTCDCDDGCFNNNRCCPDYYDLCSGTTVAEEFDTDIASEEVVTSENHTIFEKSWTTIKSVITTLDKHKHTTILPTTRRIPTKYPLIRGTTTPIRITSVRPLQPTTFKFIETTTRRVLTPPVKFTPKNYPNYTRPIVYLQTPPPTPTIYRKILPTSTARPFILTKYSTVPFKATDTNNDELEVPRPTHNYEGLLEDIADDAKEFWSDEIENSVDTPFHKNFSESDKLFSQTAEQKAFPSFLIVGISLTALLISISVVVFVLIRKYRFSRGFMSSNGQSQSDVRYLTSDDVLDFSIPDCYTDNVN